MTDETLPKLPRPYWQGASGLTDDAFDAGQMQAYAREAVRQALAERGEPQFGPSNSVHVAHKRVEVVKMKPGDPFIHVEAGEKVSIDITGPMKLYEHPAPAEANALDARHHGLDTAERVRFYEHDFYPLSNFSAFRVKIAGRDFDTSEHAYHWHKFLAAAGSRWDTGDSSIQELIQSAPSAHEAFKLAERMKPHRRPDWDNVKVNIMREILRAKAAQHEYVRRKLLATGDRELVEDSWRDDFWGWGPNRDGQNMLGILWMEVRAELRAAIDRATSKGAL